jgi:hypothetical protein
MSAEQPRCLRCQRSTNEVPLIALSYNGQEYWICAQDLPVLIHKPGKLSEQLPGAEQFPLGEGHEQHHE